MIYIGLDVGTSGCKAAVVDASGTVSAFASREYSLVFPASGYAELNPDTVWSAVKDVLNKIAPKAKNAKAIAVSSIGESMVILDDNDQPLTNGITYLDQRCKHVVSEIAKVITPQALSDITLVPLNQMFSLNKLIWYKNNQPSVLEKGRKFFLFADFITYKLSGSRAIDPGTASRTMFFDARNLEWSGVIAEKFEVPTEKFSAVIPTGTDLGPILPGAAQETGLPGTMRVLVGTHDQIAASLGSGAITPGNTTLGEGTSESLNLIIKKEHITLDVIESGFGYEPYLRPNLYMIPIGQSAHGICISWFVNLFKTEYEALNKNNERIYAVADSLCADDPGNLFFLPYLSRTSAAEAQNNAPGCFIGMELTTGRDMMYRAVLEGLSYETRILTELLKRSNIETESIIATGGGARSALLMQIKSDILKMPINVLKNTESGIAGLGMICSVASGDYKDYEEAIQNTVKVASSYKPERDYERNWQIYRKIRNTIKELYATI